MFTYKFWYGHVLLWGAYTRTEIAGTYAEHFEKLPCQTVQNDCAILHPYQYYMKVPISLYSRQQLLPSGFFITAVLMAMKWYLFMVVNKPFFNVHCVGSFQIVLLNNLYTFQEISVEVL